MDIDVVTVNLHRPRKITGTIISYQSDCEKESDESDEIPI